MFRTKNSVYCRPDISPPPAFSIPLSTLFPHPPSKSHSVVTCFPETLHFLSLNLPGYFQSRQLIPSLELAGHFVVELLEDSHPLHEGVGLDGVSAGGKEAQTQIAVCGLVTGVVLVPSCHLNVRLTWCSDLIVDILCPEWEFAKVDETNV